jgi:glycosyltransferase involved in cell wall biosynthesis
VKIGFFTNSYLPYLSGVTISINLLRNDLAKLGHDVYILAPKYPDGEEIHDGIIRTPSLPTHYPGFRLSVPFLNKIPKLDIVHAHSPFGMGVWAKSVSVWQKAPLVYTFHTLFTRYAHHFPLLPQSFTKQITVGYLRLFCNVCDLILAPSEMTRRALKAWRVKQPIQVVPTGIDLEKLAVREDIRMKHRIPRGAKVLLFVGRLTKEKNIGFLIEAFLKLYKQNQNTYLILVGEGPLLYNLKRQRIPNLILAGKINRNKIFSYYAASDLFVFASRSETQGLVLCEAKAMGLPVVAVFSGGISDVVQSGIDGYVVPPNALDSFADHVLRLLNNEALYASFKISARKDATERFSSKIIAKSVEKIYNSLTQNR